MSVILPSGDSETVDPATDPVVEKDSGEVQSEEKQYTGSDVASIVKDRLAREQKKFAADYDKRLKAEKEQWQKSQKPNQSVEEEFKAKLTEYEGRTKLLSEKVSRYQGEHLNNQIERALVAQGCIDPALVAADLKSQGLVSLDEEGELVVENHRSLDDLAKSYLAKKPYLVKATTQGGLGTKQPSNVSATIGDPSKRSLEEIENALGIKSTKRNALFGK